VVDQIIEDALVLKASDIHLEPQENGAVVRFRIDGVLHEAGKIPKEYFDLGGEADGQSIEGQLHGPDNVPGPAYIDPGNPASSPSMAISNGEDLTDKFSWEETYEKNVDEGNAWKNRIPYR
jgi:hypothetical protein